MTNEELCEIMDNSNFLIDSNNKYDMKIYELLKKQIPKKPLLHHFYEEETDYSYYTCPNRCDKYCQVNRQDNFCRCCGQALDWDEDDDETRI